jgi:hypothetical protein
MREDLSLNAFTDIDHVERVATYVEAFDGIAQLQELTQIARSQVQPE